MKAHFIIVLAVMAGFCGGGCVTGKLWSDKEYVVPAPDPKLALSQTPHGIVAQYNASYERDGKVKRLAYYVEPNLERIGKNKRPVFIDPAKAGPPIVIPIFPAPGALETRPQLFAVYSTNLSAFSIYCRGEEVVGPCGLPVFKDPRQTAAQWALTPLAVAGDATIVGAIAGAIVGPYFIPGVCVYDDGGTPTHF